MDKLFSGLTQKVRLSFTSSNSSFTECARQHFLSLTFNFQSCTTSPYTNCKFTQTEHPTISSLATLTSCLFTSLSSTGNGGAILFTLTGTLTISYSLFERCSVNVSSVKPNGGGAVCVESGYLVASSNSFLRCSSSYYAGGLIADKQCTSSTVSSCTFYECTAFRGAALITYFHPSSSVVSSRFLCCSVDNVGGGIYHNSDLQSSSFILSDCLFAFNSADYTTDEYKTRGGGGFEDFKEGEYSSYYSYSFFHGNVATKEDGHDIAVVYNSLPESNITHCFTTTSIKSFWNINKHEVRWLPEAMMNPKVR